MLRSRMLGMCWWHISFYLECGTIINVATVWICIAVLKSADRLQYSTLPTLVGRKVINWSCGIQTYPASLPSSKKEGMPLPGHQCSHRPFPTYWLCWHKYTISLRANCWSLFRRKGSCWICSCQEKLLSKVDDLTLKGWWALECRADSVQGGDSA